MRFGKGVVRVATLFYVKHRTTPLENQSEKLMPPKAASFGAKPHVCRLFLQAFAFPHGVFPVDENFVGIMYDSVQDSVSEGTLTNSCVPSG